MMGKKGRVLLHAQSPELRESMKVIQTFKELPFAWNIVLVRQAVTMLRREAEELAKLDEGPFFQAKFFDFYPEEQGATENTGADHLFVPSPVQTLLESVIKQDVCSGKNLSVSWDDRRNKSNDQ